jgi:hypothetical protein
MNLPQSDADYLAERGLAPEIIEEAGMTCIVLPQWPLPAGYNREIADLLIRLQPGYPDLPPDMWWFAPALTHSNGSEIEATQVTEVHLGRSWQRWSRHFNAGQWQSGIDGLESYLALINRELARCVGVPA